ncbi:ribokinase [Paenibacillus sp. FSL H8-0548]|uniref:ribokinase n=1 Tax=Paenibacillus sp. FSL H8-0548 TaxID=1920422 RepID=UPI00096C4D24|nr:ribokinase [Paenibacillus sp. FSL H8-0548]OMF22190.1 ribokinase [Paenibacillus sp. FSL H8-0548]
MKKLLVVGSINMDIVSNVNEFPLPGETIPSIATSFFPGGKGANQAVAAARAGASCQVIGAVGEDPFAETLTSALHNNGIATDQILRKKGSSGFAIITVNEKGENNIVLSEGANGQLSAEDAAAGVGDWRDVYAVLLQNEIPWETTLSVMTSARGGAKVFYNPAPAREIPESVFPLIDTLIINETEAAVVSGLTLNDLTTAQAAAEWILAKGTSSVIVTLGEKGSIYKNAQGNTAIIPAFKVSPVDTTAAGDTFFGAYAAASAEGLAAEQALMFASAAAALAVTKAGAQSSIPDKAEIEAFLRSNTKQ